jgi:hypothetical protein
MSTQDPPPDTGASDVTATPLPAEVLAATQGARTVIAPSDDGRDHAYRQGRAAATALCAALKARLILVDRATESWWIDPYGSGPVTADTDLYSHGERPLDRGEVAALGHGELAEQMDQVAAAGVEVAAYLGRHPGFRNLRETLEHIPVDVVFAVDWLEHPDLGDRFHLRSGFLDRLREVAGQRMVVVLSADGTLRAYTPLAAI